MIWIIIVVTLQTSLVVHHKKNIMKIIITESKIYNIVKKQLTKRFGDLTPVESSNWPDSVFYLDKKKVCIEYDKQTREAKIYDESIWSFLEEIFQLSNGQIRKVITEWLREHYNLDIEITLKNKE